MNAVCACDCPGWADEIHEGCCSLAKVAFITLNQITKIRQAFGIIPGFLATTGDDWYWEKAPKHPAVLQFKSEQEAQKYWAAFHEPILTSLRVFCGSACRPENFAHSVPFAHAPGKKVVEKFLIQVETPETSTYCACPTCSAGRRSLWRAIISAQINNRLNGADPFKIHPNKHIVTITPEP